MKTWDTVAFSAVLLMELWTHPIIPVLTKWLENVAFSEFLFLGLGYDSNGWDLGGSVTQRKGWNAEGTSISSQPKRLSLFLSKKENKISVDLMV